ncbi:MAG: DNA mismatch repair endonuclease MutH [Kangiellaceae bacterium]|nr:DNA mismatch repair endonuclease MutH [Kangiellaceae bacterium]
MLSLIFSLGSFKTMIQPPTTVLELEQRAQTLAGKTIGELATEHDADFPEDLKIQKGWQGQFIEQCLGADAGNRSEPDFRLIGVELKTLPIDYQGKVQESTYVSVVDINKQLALLWDESVVYHKLKHVLWVPIAKRKGESTSQSTVATPFLWRANPDELSLLKTDWENAMELIAMGKIHQLTAKMGEILQVRPKAANSKVLTNSVNERGEPSQTLPRGFYLRSQFTQKLLNQNLKK